MELKSIKTILFTAKMQDSTMKYLESFRSKCTFVLVLAITFTYHNCQQRYHEFVCCNKLTFRTMTVRVMHYHMYSLICNTLATSFPSLWIFMLHVSMGAAILFAMHVGKFIFIFTSATQKSTENAEWLASAFTEKPLPTMTSKNDRECIW